MNTDSIRQTYEYTVQALTPVHIGCGKSYVQHFDFIQDGQRVRVFDHNRLFAQVEGLGEQAISAFTVALESEDVAGFIREYKVSLDDALRHSFSLPNRTHPPRDIRQYIRDGMGRPIIPGSSLKGLFRSAILSRLVNEQGQDLVDRCSEDLLHQRKINPKYADAALTRELFGRDAKFNLMRSLTVTDCSLEPSAVRVEPAVVTRLVGSTTFKQKSWKMWIEGLRPGADATGQVSFDMYLQREAKGKEQFAFKAFLTLEWLVEALRLRTRTFLDKELDFLSDKTGDDTEALRRFYARMQREIDRLAPNEAIAQFAWGSGWKGMTGEVLGPALRSRTDIRSLLQLAPRYLDFPFPKSRRLIDRAYGAEPIGWIKLVFRTRGSATGSPEGGRKNPTETLLERIDGVENWDQLRQLADEDSTLAGQRADATLAAKLKEAGIRVHNNYPKTWKEDRNRSMATWLEPSGLTWEVEPASDGIQTPDLSIADQEQLTLIDTLQDWDQVKNYMATAGHFSPAVAQKLKKVFQENGWHKKNVKPDKKELWAKLKSSLKNTP